MEKRQLRIEVLGTSFVIQSDESAEHLARLSSYVKARIDEVKSRYNFADPLTVALLAALNIADDMLKVREAKSRPARVTRSPAWRNASSAEWMKSCWEHTPYPEEPHTP